MKRTYTNRRYLDLLNQRVVIFDGAMGTNLQKMNLTPEQFGGERWLAATMPWCSVIPRQSRKSIVRFWRWASM